MTDKSPAGPGNFLCTAFFGPTKLVFSGDPKNLCTNSDLVVLFASLSSKRSKVRVFFSDDSLESARLFFCKQELGIPSSFLRLEASHVECVLSEDSPKIS